MSTFLVEQYVKEVERLIRFGGSKNEGALEQAFANLLNEYCKQKGFQLVPKISIKTPSGKTIIPDGTIKDSLRLDWGYWESKDEKDDLDEEIQAKFRKEYPRDNILFEDHTTAVLYQGGKEVGRVAMSDAFALDMMLNTFVNYERPEVRNFREAIKKFKEDVPQVAATLRELILNQGETNSSFKSALRNFWDLCKESINPAITQDDIREMLIQHILTEEIFTTIFEETQFHRENNIAKELGIVEQTFFTGMTKRNTLEGIKHYYDVIKANAAGIADHHEKQKFLKVVYETFYKAYNPKAADRLGIVYTPNEIVKFMIELTDWLLHKHFGRGLGDKNVEILDPATGTGTFICDIIDYLSDAQLEYKYKNEIHANEVAILPYYIANLNIEFTYKQRTGKYAEFENICFVDTLDNMGFAYKGQQAEMFGFAPENASRIKRQNKSKISVIIGNPPYNANQANENDNNKNRPYDIIDKRIKETYIKASTAQKTKLYDMYARFFRWACDRIGDDGIIAFVTNRSFIEASGYDGFRKVMADEFSECYIVDLGGDVRKDPRLSGPKNNVFAIQTGVAISFWIKKSGTTSPAIIHYIAQEELETAANKLAFLSSAQMRSINFKRVAPDLKHNWVKLVENGFEHLLALVDKATKTTNGSAGQTAVFKLFTLGSVTNRDEWVYDDKRSTLEKKVAFFIKKYNAELKRLGGKLTNDNVHELVSKEIKFTRDVKKDLVRGTRYKFRAEEMRECLYRPFVKKHLYFAAELNEMQYQMPRLFPFADSANKLIAINQGTKEFNVLASRYLVDLHFNGDAQCIPLYRYDENGTRIDNITDWGLEQFREHYANKKITREDIFHYVYGVLHDPKYRKKYELNLKREFPRVPFYADFKKWSKWGKTLMDLHIGYETVKPYPGLKVTTAKWDEAKNGPPKAKLKADKAAGIITLDEATQIHGIPAEAWDYKLGNRSALEWILDQYKEKTPKDATIREKFNTYKFADYKDKVIDLLGRVTTVSVETVGIMKEMDAAQG